MSAARKSARSSEQKRRADPVQCQGARGGPAMLCDLVQTTTRDGVRLDGVYQAPAARASLPVDAFVLVHGTGGNFYSSTLLDALAAMLLDQGVGALRVNTRGHDLISTAATA